jgi:hypothetical protein
MRVDSNAGLVQNNHSIISELCMMHAISKFMKKQCLIRHYSVCLADMPLTAWLPVPGP